MKTACNYPIGVPGVPWRKSEERQWLWSRRKHPCREYATDVPFYSPEDDEGFHAVSYGVLTAPFYIEEESEMGKKDYLLHGIVSDTFYPPGEATTTCSAVKHFPPARQPTNIERHDSTTKPTILITGGVHGYETSGIKGALKFVSSGLAKTYSTKFNIVIVPCVSPWGYEMDERWTATATDPNRSFGVKTEDNPTPIRTDESTALLNFLDALSITTDDGVKQPKWLCHLDLHETTDTDVTEFRPAKAARDGLLEYDDHIPDGFYLLGHCRQDDNRCNNSGSNSDHYQQKRQQNHLEFYNAILKRVEKVTHIAESESDGSLCGHTATSRGLLLLPCAQLGICAGGAVPEVSYAVTTEVYPDSNHTSEAICVQAQIESICAALDFLLTVE